MSELKKNKRALPKASMVLDDDGNGVTEWDLGKAGTGLIVLNDKGVVTYFSRQAPSEAKMASLIKAIRASIKN